MAEKARRNGRETAPSSLHISKSDWLLPEMQHACIALFREIAKAMAYKNLDPKLKHEYPFVVHHFTGGVQWKPNTSCSCFAFTEILYYFPSTLIMQVFIKRQQQNFPELTRRGRLDNISSAYLKPYWLLLAETLGKMVNSSWLYNARESSLQEKYLLEKVCNAINDYVRFRHQGMIYRGTSEIIILLILYYGKTRGQLLPLAQCICYYKCILQGFSYCL